VKYILARAHRGVIEQFAWSRMLLGLDFDGTLAPLRLARDEVTLGARTRALVADVAALYPTVVISGRARKDVAGRLRGLPLYEIIGNHGLEPAPGARRGSNGHPPTAAPDARQVAAEVARWMVRLHRDLDVCKGVEIEDKGFSLAIHYRRSREKKKALAAITASVARLGPLRALGGKLVVNLLPEGAAHKGLALLGLLARSGCDTAIYVGDDDTDEDVFALAQPGRLLTVRVGKNHDSFASYYLRHRGEVEILLRALRDVRAGRRS
jgi:trehalose 6-phosphate phosphatase